MNKKIDMTNGPLFKNIVLYTLPIIATSILSLMFNTMDLLVVGQYCGSTTVGAVGSTGSIITLITTLFLGLSVGVSVTVAQGIGAQEKERVSAAVHTAILVAMIGGATLTVIGLTCSRQFLEWMGNPAETIELAAVYMRIYFCGMIFQLIYNFGSAILRAAGDTVRPLIYLSAAGVLNVVLNLIFVRFFSMSVDGVALATIISQMVSMVLVIGALRKRTDGCHLRLRSLKLDRRALRRIIGIGLPAGIQSSMFSIANVIIQSSVNSFGAAAVTGAAAASNLEGYAYVSINSFAQTMMNFAGQNYGAGKPKRVKTTLKICLALVMGVGIVMGGGIFLLRGPLLGMYITDSAAAMQAGISKLKLVCLPYFLCGIMDVVGATLRGMGRSVTAMVISVFGICGLRLIWIFTLFRLPEFHSLEWLFLTYPISWLITFGLSFLFYLRYRNLPAKLD